MYRAATEKDYPRKCNPRRARGGSSAPGIVRAVLTAAFFLSLAANADDGFWSKTAGGSWANANNWDSQTIADGTDNTAYFGIALFADIPSSATFTVDGARTIGHVVFTDQNGPDNWSLNTGTGGPLTLDATFDTPSITVGLASQVVTINTALAGLDGMEKLGDGTLVLVGTNLYTGGTLVSAGTLRINGAVGTNDLTVATGSLGGTGLITGPVTVQSGALLEPGNSLGTLTISNSLTLQAGSTTRIEVNATTSGRDQVRGLSSVSYGGTLIVSNLNGTLTLGQSFAIFNAASTTGNFNSITPNPGPALRWRFDPSSGVLSVVSSNSQPVISGITRAGTNVLVQATNGPPAATTYLLGSTNVALAVSNWSRLATNTFDVSGNINFTNGVSAIIRQRYYRIMVPTGP